MMYELAALMRNAMRDGNFKEIYHPDTGYAYGGLQECRNNGIRLWDSCLRQTWSATAFIRIVLFGILGMEFSNKGIKFFPNHVIKSGRFIIEGIPYRGMILNIEVYGRGNCIKIFNVNGIDRKNPFIGAEEKGNINISITVGN